MLKRLQRRQQAGGHTSFFLFQVMPGNALSPDLKTVLRSLSRAWTSIVIHGFLLGRILMRKVMVIFRCNRGHTETCCRDAFTGHFFTVLMEVFYFLMTGRYAGIRDSDR